MKIMKEEGEDEYKSFDVSRMDPYREKDEGEPESRALHEEPGQWWGHGWAPS